MKKRITISLLSDQQFYDILNKTYLIGRSREGLESYSPEIISSMKASEDDEDLNQIKRSCIDAISTIKERMAEYLEDDTTSANNTLKLDNTTNLSLLMPSNYTTAATSALASICHKFITHKVCYDWFLLTSPTDASAYLTEMTNDFTELRSALNKRSRPLPPGGHTDCPAGSGNTNTGDSTGTGDNNGESSGTGSGSGMDYEGGVGGSTGGNTPGTFPGNATIEQ